MYISSDSVASASSNVAPSPLKDQSRERTGSSGGRAEVGEGSAARGSQAEAGGEGAADPGASEA